jgi:hypothetical protein
MLRVGKLRFGRQAGAVWLAITLISGCAVLTPSQVKEVERFVRATQEYGALPGKVELRA